MILADSWYIFFSCSFLIYKVQIFVIFWESILYISCLCTCIICRSICVRIRWWRIIFNVFVLFILVTFKSWNFCRPYTIFYLVEINCFIMGRCWFSLPDSCTCEASRRSIICIVSMNFCCQLFYIFGYNLVFTYTRNFFRFVYYVFEVAWCFTLWYKKFTTYSKIRRSFIVLGSGHFFSLFLNHRYVITGQLIFRNCKNRWLIKMNIIPCWSIFITINSKFVIDFPGGIYHILHRNFVRPLYCYTLRKLICFFFTCQPNVVRLISSMVAVFSYWGIFHGLM